MQLALSQMGFFTFPFPMIGVKSGTTFTFDLRLNFHNFGYAFFPDSHSLKTWPPGCFLRLRIGSDPWPVFVGLV